MRRTVKEHRAGIAVAVATGLAMKSVTGPIEAAAMALARLGLDGEALTATMVHAALNASTKANAWAAAEEDIAEREEREVSSW